MDDKELAVQLKRSMSRLMKILRKKMRESSTSSSAEETFSLTELSTLGLIYRQGEIIPSALAAREKVTNQSMSQIINKLSRLGYVEKTRSREDRRKILITMTPEGEAFVKQRIHEKEEWLGRAISEKVTKSEKEILSKTVNILTKLAGD